MTTTDERLLAWALLSRAALASPDTVRILLAAHGPVDAAERIVEDGVRSRFGPQTRVTAELDLERAQRAGGRLLTRDDPGWPAALNDLDTVEAHTPIALWTRGPGQLNLLTDRSIAVVGTRAPTSYGEKVARYVGMDLAAQGWTILSGGAFGIDAAAHAAALEAGRPTVAVLPCGLHRLFPQGNAALLAEIEKTGLLVSEYPPGVEPNRNLFLGRNRIVAALAAGIVVCESGIRSGTSNTVRWGNTLRRPVMAVPGPVDSAESRGCHEFIRTGQAQLVTTARDVLDVLAR
ncbi:DNA-protecting protein DprA [Nocardia sp. SYP-A9097]|uniref:DNA-processing protein DprA n=1 Tax=Nocardia sp. SYP-A9097 TaxID=2663237 RepID=UPI00129A85BA|nr:DNA-processing protein DprA [Nocardia sp. SYP-A9097]MRH91565.1 DNA-protecting protein DprA [Nocardia sp. SYP-A9097]